MQLTVRQACEFLKIPERTLYRLIQRNEIPSFQVGHHHLLNKADVLEWAIEHKVQVSPEIFSDADMPTERLPSFLEALEAGGVRYDVPGADRSAVFRNIVASLPATEVNREFLLAALMARESLGSTAIGDGIAIPHVRNPIVLNVHRPVVLLAFLAVPVDFGALDRRKVDTMFTLVSTTVRVHLHLLARLSFALQNQNFRQALSGRLPPEKILAAAQSVEAGIEARPSNGEATRGL